MSKYFNKKVECDGIVFESKREYRIYIQLLGRLQCGEIKELNVHPRYDFKIDGKLS